MRSKWWVLTWVFPCLKLIFFLNSSVRGGIEIPSREGESGLWNSLQGGWIWALNFLQGNHMPPRFWRKWPTYEALAKSAFLSLPWRGKRSHKKTNTISSSTYIRLRDFRLSFSHFRPGRSSYVLTVEQRRIMLKRSWGNDKSLRFPALEDQAHRTQLGIIYTALRKGGA